VDGDAAPVDPRTLRVSDAEREHVVQLLNRAVGHGMLTLDEFAARTDTAHAASTRAELNGVLVDLPGLTTVSNQLSPVRETLVLRQTASTLRRRGPWMVPRRIEVRNRLGSVLLDFSEANIAHREVVIDVENELGSITMILPEGATVDADGLRLTMSSVTNKVRTQDRPGPRHFVLTGRMSTGSLTVTAHRTRRVGPFVVHRRPFRISRRRRSH